MVGRDGVRFDLLRRPRAQRLDGPGIPPPGSSQPFECLPDGENYHAIKYGPIALASASSPYPNEALQFFADDSRMGHMASGQLCPLIEAPRSISNASDFYKDIQGVVQLCAQRSRQ